MTQVFKTREALLNKYNVAFALTELEENLQAQNWSTKFNSYVYTKDGDGFLLQVELYPCIYAEYYTLDGKELDDRIHIVILDEEFEWVDGYNLNEDKTRIFRKADCTLDAIAERNINAEYDRAYDEAERRTDDRY